MAARTFAEILKQSPDTGDVHIRGGRAESRRSAAARPARKQPKPIPDENLNDDDPALAKRQIGVLKIAKVDEDERTVFGWASVVTKGGKLIVDKQGDVIEPQVLESAAYDYMLDSRRHGHMHTTVFEDSGIIESMMFTAEKQKALGIDLGQEGWWVGYYVKHDDMWADIKAGKLPEFSIGGLAVPVDHTE